MVSVPSLSQGIASVQQHFPLFCFGHCFSTPCVCAQEMQIVLMPHRSLNLPVNYVGAGSLLINCSSHRPSYLSALRIPFPIKNVFLLEINFSSSQG